MICERCGVVNRAGRTLCIHCLGSLKNGVPSEGAVCAEHRTLLAPQFTDALANDDVAAARLVVCSSENPQATGEKVPYEVRKLAVTGSTGTLTLVKHPQSGQDVAVPAIRLVKQDGRWQICGTA